VTTGDVPATGGRPVLVVGSYPPVTTPGAEVTLETVRRLWAEGDRPIVSSPRTSAADYEVAVYGILAGRRLTQLARATGARRLVLCAEAGFPVPSAARVGMSLPTLQRLTVTRLAMAATAEFDHVTVVLCGDTGVPDDRWEPLLAVATVTLHRPVGPGTAGVTPLGPGSADLVHTGRAVASRLARRGLGPAYPRARAVAATALRRARATAGR
jgi:hypothetical protein